LKIALIRHGPTAWNAEGRIQGRLDVPLSDEGRSKMAALRAPPEFETARAFSSPLSRARETARLLGLTDIIVDPRLLEHDWGDWQGLTRAEILARDGLDAFDRAGTGEAFTPKGGEPTRDLVDRVRDFLLEVGSGSDHTVAVTHRGVLRSAYAIATGWKMLSPMPEALDLSCALVLEIISEDIRVAALNVSLPPR